MKDSKVLWTPGSRLERFSTDAFLAAGLPADEAARVVKLMTEADLQGADGHGIISRIRSGGINVWPDIMVVRERAAMAVVDGDHGMDHLVVSCAVEFAIAKARESGVAWVGTRSSNLPARLRCMHACRCSTT